MSVRYIEYKDIDLQKWNLCITTSMNGIFYALSEYLDIVSPQWDALVENDYESVMPLPHRKKLGIEYIFRPPLTQQLGIFSKQQPNKQLIDSFIEAIPEKFRYIEISMNTMISPDNCSHLFETGITHHLELNNPYSLLKRNYSSNTKRNISKTLKSGLSISKSNDYNVLKVLIQDAGQKWVQQMNAEYTKDMTAKLLQILGLEKAELLLVNNSEGKLLSAAVFVRYSKFITYLFGISNSQGKQQNAMFFMFDSVIQKYSGQNLILDFEGSKIEGVARFFKGFGAQSAEFPKIKINRLPIGLKIFKR